jgi:Flp pilus assembly protein TadB
VGDVARTFVSQASADISTVKNLAQVGVNKFQDALRDMQVKPREFTLLYMMLFLTYSYLNSNLHLLSCLFQIFVIIVFIFTLIMLYLTTLYL